MDVEPAVRDKDRDPRRYIHYVEGTMRDCTGPDTCGYCAELGMEPPEQGITARMPHNPGMPNALDRKQQPFDPVERPAHYNLHPSGVECIEITEHYNFNIGNAIKYLWRAGLKSENPRQDMEKAIWYINRELQRRKHEQT